MLETLRKSLRASLSAAQAAPNAGFEAWLTTRNRPVVDPFGDAEIVSVSAAPNAVRVHRKVTDATQPLEPGVVVDGVSPWTGVSALKFDGKSSVKLPSLELSGAEPFSMTTWLHLPKIELHPGQTGGSLALVIAGQMTAGDSERTPPVAPTGWVFEIDEGVPRLRLVDADGKVIRAQAPFTSRSRRAPGTTSP